jgi:hypothetical protein
MHRFSAIMRTFSMARVTIRRARRFMLSGPVFPNHEINTCQRLCILHYHTNTISEIMASVFIAGAGYIGSTVAISLRYLSNLPSM